jgi:hypothetical protein
MLVQAITDHLDLYVEKHLYTQIDLKEMLLLYISTVSVQKN